MWADNRMEIIKRMRGHTVLKKSRGCKNRYIVNNFMLCSLYFVKIVLF